jgi:plasmid maintenance system antidote protein VapI
MGRAAIYEGELLAELLEELRMSAVELSRQLKVITNHITEILNGRCSVTDNTA